MDQLYVWYAWMDGGRGTQGFLGGTQSAQESLYRVKWVWRMWVELTFQFARLWCERIAVPVWSDCLFDFSIEPAITVHSHIIPSQAFLPLLHPTRVPPIDNRNVCIGKAVFVKNPHSIKLLVYVLELLWVTHSQENSSPPPPPASISWYRHRAFASVFAFCQGMPIFCHLQEISNAMDQSENINLLHKITTITSIIFKLLTSIIPLEIWYVGVGIGKVFFQIK